jgi:hypothetical protein
MKPNSNSSTGDERHAWMLTMAGALMLLLTIARLAVSGGTPRLWSPYPMAQFLFLSIGWPVWLCLIAVAGCFLSLLALVAWVPGSRLWVGWLIGGLTVASVVYFVLRAAAGFAHQGPVYVMTMIVANVAAVWLLWNQWRSLPQQGLQTLALPFTVVLWLSWFAFPYFGEGI